LNKFSWKPAVGALLSAAAVVSWTGVASAEIELAAKDGWTVFFDGRVNAFFTYAFGDAFPEPNADDHSVGGGAGIQPEPAQENENGDYAAMRVRSGFLSNVFGFGVKRQIDQTTSLKAYIGIWSTVETIRRDNWEPNYPDAREGYLKLEGPWGSFLAGRSLALFGRGATQIDFMYGHNFGVGHPCNDAVGPTCGHIGTGVLFPGFSAGLVYGTPRLAGLSLEVGVYDPIRLLGAWESVPYPRPQAALTFEQPLGDLGKVHLFSEGVYQYANRTDIEMDGSENFRTTSAWGVTGGGRLEIGPARLGGGLYYGRGLGFFYALQNTPNVTFDNDQNLRYFDGYYGQAALIFGKLHVAAGAGIARMKLGEDETGVIGAPKDQLGISGAVYYHLYDYLVLGLDYFRLQARWYSGEKQDVNFLNAGVTVHW
jgi:hypothetical protein